MTYTLLYILGSFSMSIYVSITRYHLKNRDVFKYGNKIGSEDKF